MTDVKQRESKGKKTMPVSPGRPKGVPNKTTQAAKDAIAMAADRLGGVDRLVEWAQEDPSNERAFWTAIYPKLLPLQVSGEGGGPIKVARIELVAMGANDSGTD